MLFTNQGVTNLAGRQEAFHVKNVALFALGAIAAVTNIYVDEDDPKQGHAHLRVGFHSGKQISIIGMFILMAIVN